MHEKITLIDGRLVFLGSANSTSESLTMHDNLVSAISSEPFAALLKEHLLNLGSPQGPLALSLKGQNLEMFFLPDKTRALKVFLEAIESARRSIQVAFFTFTHPEIHQALLNAQQRGVKVSMTLDRYCYSASKKTFLDENFPLYLSPGPKLFHHKWMLIDGKTLLFGSANGTKAAFKSNQDYFIKLSPLSHENRKVLRRIYHVIEKERVRSK